MLPPTHPVHALESNPNNQWLAEMHGMYLKLFFTPIFKHIIIGSTRPSIDTTQGFYTTNRGPNYLVL